MGAPAEKALEEGELEDGELAPDLEATWGGGDGGGVKRGRGREEEEDEQVYGDVGIEGDRGLAADEGAGGVRRIWTPRRGGGGDGKGYSHGGQAWTPPPFAGKPAMAPLAITPPVSQYMGPLAGWAGFGRATMPPPGRLSATTGSVGSTNADATGAVLPFDTHVGGLRGRDGPHTTGKDGRDGRKRLRTGRHSWQDASGPSGGHPGKSTALMPCLFWRQGMCKNGDECGYLHGDSPIPCTNFNTRAGCRFGDKCAFAHVPGPRDDPAAASDPGVNPFATHATNCGCPVCNPRAAPRVVHVAAPDGEGEDGEVLEVVEDPEEGEEQGGDQAAPDTSARDAVLAACAVIESPAMVEAWTAFLRSAKSGRSNGLVPFWKQQQTQQTRGGR